MRILHLIPSLSGGGAERQLSYLAPALASAGHEVHIAYVNLGMHAPELPGVELHKLCRRSNYSPWLIWELYTMIKQLRPQVVQTWILQMDVCGGIAAQLAGVPWVFREPSSSLAYHPTWKNRLRIAVGAAAGTVISNSHGGDDYWARHIPSERRHIVPNALAFTEIDTAPAEWPTVLPNFSAPMALYAGRLASDGTARKNLRTFLQAIARVRRDSEIVGVLCGDGPQRRELELLGHELRLDGALYFTGFLPAHSVWGLIKHAAIFVSLSEYEGCPNTVMEAMACACPLVISDIPAHREILSEETAIFVEPHSVDQAADAIRRVLKDPAQANVQAWRARQEAQNWKISTMKESYLRIYQTLV